MQRSFVEDEMRRMETESMVVYYPAPARDAVVEVTERLEACSNQLRALARPSSHREKMVVLFTSAEFNNAYVQGRIFGNPAQMVLPLQMGSEIFNFFDFGVSNIGDVACHEAAHYVQLEQIEGFWRYANLIFGDVVSPNVGTESWFLEGLATYFEGHLGREYGRPHSPLWTSSFASGVARQNEVRSGQLSFADRSQYPFGGNYLTGSHFVGWLAKKYGEEKLWELVDVQGRSIFFTLGVTLRFWSVYGKTIGALLNEYEQELLPTLGDRARPAPQTVMVEDLGYAARIATSQQGALAVAWTGLDHVSTLAVYEPDGQLRFSFPLARVVPERPWIISSPLAMSGMSFTADGQFLFFFSEDIDVDGESTYAVRKFDARTGAFLQQWTGLRGLGGDVRPDGKVYAYIAIEQGIPQLVSLDLQTGAVEQLLKFTVRASLGGVAFSPSGERLVFSRRSGPHGWDLYLREQDGTVRALTTDGRFNYGAQWVDDERVILMREQDETAQVFELTVATGALRQLSKAPWAAFDPWPLPGGQVAFLNRDGWSWSLDRIPAASSAAPHDVTLGAARPHAEAPTARLNVLTDEAYSPLDSLFVPRLRVPYITLTTDEQLRFRPGVGLSIMGFDRLGHHAWALNAAYDGTTRELNGSVTYGTGLLAPWYVAASAARNGAQFNLFAEGQPSTAENIIGTQRITDLSLSASASRPLFTSSVAFGVDALWRTDRVRRIDGTEEDTDTVRLIGPSAAASWFAVDGTAYAGTTRGLSASGSIAAFPEVLGSDYTLLDTRAALTGWIPTPWLDRDSLALSVRVHAVPGPVEDLLAIGGSGGLNYFLLSADAPQPPSPSLLTPGLAFSEPLRGFEDVLFRANAVAIAGARYRYAFIVDRGVTSVLWLFPSAFWRQVELEGFAEAARTDERTQPLHVAFGSMLRSRFLWSGAPFSLYVQYAYRLDPGLGSMVLVGASLD